MRAVQVVLVIVIAGCAEDRWHGDTSGLPADERIVALDASEISALCEFYVDASGSARTIDCGGGAAVFTGGRNQQDCEDDLSYFASTSMSCTATVAEYESCIKAIAAQPDPEICQDVIPAECAVVLVAPCFEGTGR